MSKKIELQKLYRKIPKIDCIGKCHTTCGVIPVSKFEREKISEIVGKDPFPTMQQGMDLILESVLSGNKSPLKCSMLTEDNKCSIYDNRPAICRLYAVTEKMPCAYGCKPAKYLPEAESRSIIKKISLL